MSGLRVEMEGAIGRITLDRPENGNRMTVEMVRGLTDVLLNLANDPQAKAVLLRGTPPDFCRGRDREPAASGPGESMKESVRQAIETIHALYDSFERVPLPIISVVQGAALGVGCAIAAACDLTIASTEARFALPEIADDRPPLLAIGALVDHVPPKALTYLAFSTDEIDGASAVAFGLASRVVMPANLEVEVERLLGFFAGRSTSALRTLKQYLRDSRRVDSTTARMRAATILADLLGPSRQGSRGPEWH